MTSTTVNPLHWSFVLTGVTLFSLPSHAQSWPDVAASEISAGAAADLLTPQAVRPQVGVGYNSAGNGYSSFSELDVFYPLWQSAGQSLGYAYGQLRRDANHNWGGTMVLGYRLASPQRVWGAYLGLDQQSTGANTFQQLGVGLESLGDWDVRLNGYLPLGKTRQVALDTGLRLKERYFRGHDLNLVLEQQQIYEAAARGVDFEVGTRLFDWGAGEVRGYGGLYYYKPTGGEGALGYRMRVTANPVDFLNLGLTMQQDSLFGSRLSFQVGATWGGAGRSHPSRSSATLARLTTPPQRTNAIAIDQQTVIAFRGTVVATNPETNQPWYFLHVNPNGGRADGQFETPFGTVEGAIAVAPSNQNTIIYVQDVSQPAGDLTIPDAVRLWSTGPDQQIDTNEIGRVTLPLSNSGIYPRIHGTVAMGNDSHLAGFTIQPPSGDDAVTGDQVRNLTIRENRITTSGEDAGGVQLDNVTGWVSLLGNQITTTGHTKQGRTGAHGVTVNQETATLSAATLTSNTITTQGTRADGVYVRTRTAAGGVEAVTLTDNVIRTMANDGLQSNDNLTPQPTPAIAAEQSHGLFVFANQKSRVGTITLERNQISTVGDRSNAAFTFAQNNAAIGQATFDQNTLTTSGYKSNAISAFPSNGGQFNQVTITRNQIVTSGDESPAVLTFATGAGSQMGHSVIQNNQVTTHGNNSDAVLAFAAQTSALGAATITGNRITTTNNYAAGLLTFASKTSTLGTVTISGNQIATQGSFSDGLLAFASQGSTLGTATITGNTVTTQGQGGTLPGTAPAAYTYNTGYSGGIMAFASNGSTLATASIQGNRVSTGGNKSNAIAVFSSSSGVNPGSTITNATLANNEVSTTQAESRGMMVFATRASTLTDATITGNTSTTQGNDADGIFAFASESQNFGQATITNNAIATHGTNAAGINLAANNTSKINGVTVTGNQSRTTGPDADGITLLAGTSSTLPSVTIQNNQATTTNARANGMAIALQNNSTLTAGTLSSNTVTTTGQNAQGIFVDTNNSTLTMMGVTANTVQTTGQAGNGIGVTATNGTTATATITQNTVNTTGAAALGIDVTANGGTFTTAQVTHNAITTAGGVTGTAPNEQGARGISVSALNNTTLGNAIATHNTITTQGPKALGIQVLAANGNITTATINTNTINTTGTDAIGLSVLATAKNNPAEITTATLATNTITTRGTDAHALSLLGSNSGQITTSILAQNQLFTTATGANGILALAKDATLTDLTINANAVRSQQFHGVTMQASNAGTIGTAALTNNVIIQAGSHSFNLVTNTPDTGAPTACVSAFTNNNSQNAANRDLSITNTTGTFNFVDFNDVATYNTGFSVINGSPTVVTSCP
ncbi:hypothetical protein PN441_11390 [Spirulina major CS-329]|uniref:beta strand repeat-containing protein n=1 Tax=Spirulina TaxID=1154 RepID=UPI0023304FDA|nr:MULTISPECIES: hypothetical protein [Spirulina]MDB9495237.1 hypothetical protein [Spirulina subsalsa CS-330]MDB9503675.1 hypothetical protein [Spirulina major CS-329]